MSSIAVGQERSDTAEPALAPLPAPTAPEPPAPAPTEPELPVPAATEPELPVPAATEPELPAPAPTAPEPPAPKPAEDPELSRLRKILQRQRERRGRMSPPNRSGTRRAGPVEGYLGIDVLGILPTEDGHRWGVGWGGGLGLRPGLAILDVIALDLGLGFLAFVDRRPLQEVVVTCTVINDVPSDCHDPRTESSSITGWYFAAEVGLQYRFRPEKDMSLQPGMMLGHFTPIGLNRRVDCDNCESVEVLGFEPAGLYVTPFFRVTGGRDGFVAFDLRPQFFLQGDLGLIMSLSMELGSP